MKHEHGSEKHHERQKPVAKTAKSDSKDSLVLGLTIAVVLLMFFNTYQANALQDMLGRFSPIQSTAQPAQTRSSVIDLSVIPKGVPRIYGQELGVSYDDVSPADQQRADAAIRKLAMLDQSITLSGNDRTQYINIASQISCEYCCGAPSIITKDGEAACGCAHSYAMRGLAKYLITKHASEYTDEQILEELGKWKTLFFPGKLAQKARVLQEKGIPLSYVNLASNKYRGIEQGAGSGAMAGGC